MRKLLLLLSLTVIFYGFTSKKVDNGGRPLSTTLWGANEAPGPGDPDGSGYFSMTLNQGQGTISYELYAEDIATPTGAHIHVGPVGSPGPIVVHLTPPVGGMSMGVVEVDPALIKAIRQNPSAYYVNVHNASYRPGAIRGQLSK
jgi:CHRD domain